MIEKQKIKSMLHANALGCLDKQDLLEIYQYIDDGLNFPWAELGKFQTIASMLPLILDPEIPDPILKDNVAVKLKKLSEELRQKQSEESSVEQVETIEQQLEAASGILEVKESESEIKTQETFNLDEITLTETEQALVEPISEDASREALPEVTEEQKEFPEGNKINSYVKESRVQKSLVEDVENDDGIEKQIEIHKKSFTEKIQKAFEQDIDLLKYNFEESEKKLTKGLLTVYIIIAVLLALLIFSFFKFSADINSLEDEIKQLKKQNSLGLLIFKKDSCSNIS